MLQDSLEKEVAEKKATSLSNFSFNAFSENHRRKRKTLQRTRRPFSKPF